MANNVAIGGGWDSGAGNAIYPWLQPNGHLCPRCGYWVMAGTSHLCSWTQPNITTTIIQEAPVSDFEMKQLEEIVDALKKARSAFEGLANDDDKGKGNRVAAYLSARFGVNESAIIDVLLEES